MIRLTPENRYLSTKQLLGLSEESNPNQLLISTVEKVVGIEKLNQMIAEIGPPWPDANQLIDHMFSRLNINWDIENPEMLERLDDRPKVFVANHPYGLPDAFALFQLLTRYRPNIKLFANKILAATRLDDERLLYVDPFMASESKGMNRKSIAHALRHLRDGGDLALFPGRICSHLKVSDWMISDSEWTDQVCKFVEISGGDMVPMFISGRNSMFFNMSGLIHPKIRTYMLLREFLRGGHDFKFQIGEPVSAEQLLRVSRTLGPGAFSRNLTYALKPGSRLPEGIGELNAPSSPSTGEMVKGKALTSITGAPVKALLDEHEAIVEQNGFSIYKIETDVSDPLLDVICQVRFTAYASETSVSDPAELRDRYDKQYNHLILWDHANEIVAGVYRYRVFKPGSIPVNPDNLVTGSIFVLKPEFLKLLPNAMELGRAAILPEYQKSYSPLMLLWRGILEIPSRDRDIKYLFGPVTMGRAFKPVSHELLRRYIMRNCQDEGMMGFVRPKRELAFEIPKEVDLDQLSEACRSFSELSSIVRGFEGGKRDLPVLFRHYANIGCRYIGFGEWKELDHATAGLTVLDLKNMSRSFLSRYFGKDGTEAFLLGR